MDLLKELAAFDGKHTEPLEALAERLAPDHTVIAELTALAGQDDAKLQTAATWLLKRVQEDGCVFSTDQIEGLLDLLEQSDSWEARLHLLQMLPAWALPAERSQALRRRLLGPAFLQAPNKFLRAWTYNALATLADQHPDYRKEVTTLLHHGAEDEAASVRARIRNAMKNKPWARASLA